MRKKKLEGRGAQWQPLRRKNLEVGSLLLSRESWHSFNAIVVNYKKTLSLQPFFFLMEIKNDTFGPVKILLRFFHRYDRWGNRMPLFRR